MTGRGSHETGRHVHLRHGYTVEAERAVALFTEEMYVKIVVIVATVPMTQLIAQGTRAILDGVHEMMLAEKCQGAEDA